MLIRFAVSASCVFVLLFFCYCSSNSPDAAIDSERSWNQWRGPDRAGILAGGTPLTALPESLNISWTQFVGKGYGSPVSDGEHIFGLTRVDEHEQVWCIGPANGTTVWKNAYRAPFRINQYALKFGKGPFSTPLVTGERLFTLGIGGILSAWNSETGDLLWRHQPGADTLNTATFFVGTAMSPLLYNNTCIAYIGEETHGYLAAFNIEDGNAVWKWQGDQPGYASPVIANCMGQKMLITLSQKKCIAIDPDTGELLWEYVFASEWRENIVTPVYWDKRVYISGVDRGILALEIQKNESGWTVSEAWKNEALSMYMSSPVLLESNVYGFARNNKGQFFCLDINSGRENWLSEGRQGSNASLVAAGASLFALTDTGELLVVAAGPAEFNLRKKYKLSAGNTWAHPLFLGDALFIKDDENLHKFAAIR